MTIDFQEADYDSGYKDAYLDIKEKMSEINAEHNGEDPYSQLNAIRVYIAGKLQ